MLLKGFEISETRILVDCGILIELAPLGLGISYYTGIGNELHIYLNSLSGILHLLIRLRDILGIRWLYRL